MSPEHQELSLTTSAASSRHATERSVSSASMTNEHYQELFDCAPNCIVGIDRQYNFIFANQPAIQLLGTPDLLGRNIWTLFPGNLEEPFFSSYRRTMEERVPTEFEAYHPAPLNQWFHVTARPVQAGMIVFFHDITAREESEAARALTAAQLHEVFEVTTDAILTVDRSWTITFLNRRAKEILAAKGELTGKNMWDEFPASADPTGPYWIAYHRTMLDRIVSEFEAFYPAPLERFFSIESRPSEEGIVLFFRDVTDRREWEQAIRSQQDLLSTVQQAALMATWDLDLAAGTLTFGLGSSAVFGHPLESTPTLESLLTIALPSHHARIGDAIRKSIKTRQMLTVDFQVIAADGTPLWIEMRGQVVGNSHAATRMSGIAIDITARKQGEEALAASEERYRILTDLNPQAIWMGAPDGSITYANQGFLDYIGLTNNDLGGSGWLDAFYPEDRPGVVAAWTHSVLTGDEYQIEARIVRARDSSPRIWWLRGLPVRDEAGAILHWLGVAMDVDDARTSAAELLRKQQETERQRAELETIYQTADIGLALFSTGDFRFLRINDHQAAIMGVAPEEVVGRPVAEVVPGIPGLLDLFRSVEQGQPIRNLILEGELTNRPGEKRFWTVNYTPIVAGDGSIAGITAATLEITQQKRAEAALIQSEKLAAVGRLASSISHEINNPLEAITNLLYLIATVDHLPEQLKVYIDMAQSELGRVSQIATQTLRFHRQAVKPTAVTPAELVGAVFVLYQGRLANSGITVEARYAARSTILCFESDIRQVLNNLIANAIDAMRTGGRLIARAHCVHDPKTDREGVRITIADTGHGMSATTLARAFEPFYTTKDLNGTGLGLWISAGIVERHQGKLTVRSSEHPRHHGTVFSLFLPSAEMPVAHPSPLDLLHLSATAVH